ncbi:EF-hand domain-containing protein [Aliiroseovarius sp. F47248L]|uniref:EF-hand domain-containing protein n=1 Tax=Aliiroseovarius sp. F47248L TaxID=2926420 RepID=UPI001FF53271|nr:EF-hand domain-containing protein [Aliiroseovarius sp. F47248L]MCK0139927.1 EF-hand domain-containing protein [Aliiroseovarius sp. F47248L]
MKTTSLAAALLIAGSSAVFADIAALDANEDGQVTMEELVAVYPDVTAEDFSTADADASGTLDADELAAAQEAGAIPSEM